MTRSTIVHKPSDLTINWAQQILNQHDHNATVSKIAVQTIDVGTTTRVRLKVDHDANNVPKNWFIKIPSLALRARLITALPRLLHTEVRFYKELARTVPVTMPVCLAAYSQFGHGSTLVLADVAEQNAIPARPGESMTAAQAALVIDELACFHGHFWYAAHHTKYRWLAGSVRRLEDGLGSALAVPLMQRGLHLAGAAIPKRLHKAALRYAKYRRKVMRFLAQAPQTLIHHDCHSGNLFWNSDKSSVGFLDWQLVRLGEGVSDVAYFLATALSPDIRQAHELELLARYEQALITQGVKDFDNSQLLNRYRAHLSYAFEAMVVTLAVGGMMNNEHNMELIKRTAASVDDLDAFSALPL